MSSAAYRWEIYPRAPKTHFDQFPDMQPLVVQILYNRGIFEVDKVYDFIKADASRTAQDQTPLKGTTEAVIRIQQALKDGESMAIYGDYDADGVTSTAMMVQALRSLGANVKSYIPDRFDEGYGLNTQAIAELATEGIDLVITVDCGIRSADEVAYGSELGLDFIITDHHQVPRDKWGQDVIPPAVAVINPKQSDCDYRFEELAGVGVAFKLLQALWQVVDHPAPLEQEILDLVAIGTVADMAPLVGENRVLVKQGLTYVNEARRVGIMALVEQTGLKPGQITAGSIGFTLGPRLNAAGRLTHAQLAYQLLATENHVEAQQLSQSLHQINVERQQMTQDFVDQARLQVLADDELAPLYLISDPQFNHGVVGLVASRLTDEFYRPMLVAHRGDSVTKGSGRSIPEFDITQALDQCADLLIKYGGHAAAAGFTVENKHVGELYRRLLSIAQAQLAERSLQKTLSIDAELNLRGVTYQLVKDVQALQPFGYSNPTPRFVTKGLIVKHQTVVGKAGNHLKMKLFDGKQVWDAIGFQLGRIWPPTSRLTTIDAVYTLEFNTWQGRTNLQLNLKDIRPTAVY